MPRMQNFAKKNGCLTSNYHFSGGHTTEYGVFAALYGLHGYHLEPVRDQDLPSYGLKTLKKQGYTLIGSAATRLSSWNKPKFIFQVFDKYKEFISNTIYEDDVNMIKWIQKQIDQSNQKPLFIFIHPNSTHHNYYFPDNFTIYKPVMEKNYNYLQNKYSTATYREKVFNRYKNSVRFLDATFTNFFENLKDKLGPDTIIVFTGDHGEEFWEHGLQGHGKSNYVNQRIQVPLIICDLNNKKLPPVNFSSHVDIFPTIFDLLGLPSSDQFNGYSMLSPTFSNRPYSVITGIAFPFGRNKIGLLDRNYKFWLKKSSKNLHYLYKIKTSDLDDNIIMDGSDKAALDNILKAFSTDAYLFLEEKHP